MKRFNTIGHEEARAAMMVVHDSIRPLSGYIGTSVHGGAQCIALEFEWAHTFNIKHAIAVNSGTSGLLAACMAVGVTHGDEVIVSAYTMSATAAAPKILGAEIIWADIEPDTYTLDPVEVANSITPKTKAVIVTNLFGHPAHLAELKNICGANGIYLIEDNAQAIFAKEDDVYAGTIGDIGVFSLNVHKHLQVGEGGICVTNDNELDKKLREAMNHGELRDGILGLNLRMTEATAAMAREQLKKAPKIMQRRVEIGQRLSDEVALAGMENLIWPLERYGCQHAFYAWAGQLVTEPRLGLPKPFKRGYLRPLYHLPAFKKTGQKPLSITEKVESNMLLVELCSIDPTNDEISQLVEQLGKVL